MKRLRIILCTVLLWSCSNGHQEKAVDLPTNLEQQIKADTSDVFVKLRRDLIVSPDLQELDFIHLETTYAFSVKNVPLEFIGAQINRGRIIMNGPGNFEFFAQSGKDSIEIKIFAKIEGIEEDIYSVRKQLKE
jgi:hypothetical protein